MFQLAVIVQVKSSAIHNILVWILTYVPPILSGNNGSILWKFPSPTQIFSLARMVFLGTTQPQLVLVLKQIRNNDISFVSPSPWCEKPGLEWVVSGHCKEDHLLEENIGREGS